MHQRHGNVQHPIYVSWRGMRYRCLNPKSTQWSRYGGRGISICEEWSNFTQFYEWAISNGWQAGLTIDRIDPNGNYEPGNCRWATALQQAINRNSRLMVKHKGKMCTLRHVALDVGISYTTIHKRYKAGERGSSLLRPADPLKSACSRGKRSSIPPAK